VGYDILRLAGAAYLIWLGVTRLRSRRGPAGAAAADGTAAGGAGGTAATDGAGEPAGRPAGPARGWRVYLNGVLSNLFNPKIGVFFVAFLPGFIPARASAAAFSLVLGLWFIVETGAWLVTLSWMVARGAGWVRGSAAQRWAERVTGVVLIGFGLRLAAETR
jgi:threonine/homoserine/homoserine lactone efflux protein